MNNHQEVNAVATVVEDPVKRIQIPPNLRPGDSFIVQPDHGAPFTVIVPEGAVPGSFINVIVPSNAEAVSGQHASDKVLVDKAVAGAAIAAGIAGLVCFGVVGGVALAGGAAYVAATQKDNKVGETVRTVGKSTFTATNKAGNWVGKQLKKL